MRVESLGIIGNLCLALAHKWEPDRLFMILTSYFDESGTHAGSPATVMGGVMASAQQWALFETGMAQLKRRYGFTVFHSKDFRAQAGQFSGWSEQKCHSFLQDFGAVGACVMEVVSCVLPNEMYDVHYRNTSSSRRVRHDTKYGICFRYSLTVLIYQAIRRLSHHRKFGDTAMHVVMEHGHRNAGDANRIFGEMSAELRLLGSDMLKSISFVTKTQSNPPMLADFFAYAGLRAEIAGVRYNKESVPKRSSQVDAGITLARFTPDTLVSAKKMLEQACRKTPTITPLTPGALGQMASQSLEA